MALLVTLIASVVGFRAMCVGWGKLFNAYEAHLEAAVSTTTHLLGTISLQTSIILKRTPPMTPKTPSSSKSVATDNTVISHNGLKVNLTAIGIA